MEFEVGSKQNTEYQNEELRDCLGIGKLKVCLGHIMLLHLARSPFVSEKGGSLTVDDVGAAMSIIPSELNEIEFCESLDEVLQRAWKVYEIVYDEEKDKKDEETSIIDICSPEWMSDMISGACRSVPSLTLEQCLWEVPICMMIHLSLSSGRYNGLKTRREADIASALKKFKELNKNG